MLSRYFSVFLALNHTHAAIWKKLVWGGVHFEQLPQHVLLFGNQWLARLITESAFSKAAANVTLRGPIGWGLPFPGFWLW